MNTPKTDQFTYRNDYVLLLESHRQLELQVQELREALELIANVNYSPMGYGDMQHAIKEARAILEKTK